MTLNTQLQLKDITSSIVQFKKQEYPEGPECMSEVNITIDASGLNLKNKNGSCYLEKTPKIGEKNFLIEGFIPFSNEKKMDLAVSLKSIDVNLFRHFSELNHRGKADVNIEIDGIYSDYIIGIELHSKKIEIFNQIYEKLKFKADYRSKKSTLHK